MKSEDEGGEIVSDDSKGTNDYSKPTGGAGTKRGVEEVSSDAEGNELDDIELDPEKRREVRKMRRVMANRRSARESRERRKKLLTDLQESVESLTSENSSLTKENMGLRRELASLIEQSGGTAPMNIMQNLQGPSSSS